MSEEIFNSMLDAYLSNDTDRVHSLILQKAANLSRSGKKKEAKEILSRLDELKIQLSQIKSERIITAHQYSNQLEYKEFDRMRSPAMRLADLVLEEKTKESLIQIKNILELKYSPYNKLLFTGLQGTGKTYSAKILAESLRLNYYIFNRPTAEQIREMTPLSGVFIWENVSIDEMALFSQLNITNIMHICIVTHRSNYCDFSFDRIVDFNRKNFFTKEEILDILNMSAFRFQLEMKHLGNIQYHCTVGELFYYVRNLQHCDTLKDFLKIL